MAGRDRLQAIFLTLGLPLLLLAGLLRLAPPSAAGPPDPQPASGAPLTSDNLLLTAHSGAAVAGVAVSATRALVGAGPALTLVDAANPAAPQRLGQLVLPSTVGDLLWAGDLAYAATANDGVYVVDVGGAVPVTLARYAGSVSARGLALLDAQLLVATAAGLQVVDVTNPAQPLLQATLPAGSAPRRVAVAGSRALVTADDGTITLLDFSTPATPTVTAATTLPGAAWDVAFSGGYGYVAWSDCAAGCSARLRVYNLNAAAPLETVADRLLGSGVARGVAVAGGYVYVARSAAAGPYSGPGVTVLDVSQPALPIVVADYDVPGSFGAADVAVSGPRAYIAYGGSGLQVAAVSDPTAPQALGAWRVPGRARAAALSGDRLLVAAGDGATRGELWQLDPDTLQAAGVFWLPSLTDARLLAADGAYAYVAGPALGGGQQLRVVSLVSPTAPLDLAGLALGNPQHLSAAGGYVYVHDGAELAIIDATSPLTPTRVGTYPVGGALTVTGTLGLLAAGDAGLQLLDLSDPAAPQLLSSVAPGWPALDLVVIGSRAYVAAGAQGVRVVDISAPLSPAVVGVFDPPWSVERLARRRRLLVCHKRRQRDLCAFAGHAAGAAGQRRFQRGQPGAGGCGRRRAARLGHRRRLWRLCARTAFPGQRHGAAGQRSALGRGDAGAGAVHDLLRWAGGLCAYRRACRRLRVDAAAEQPRLHPDPAGAAAAAGGGGAGFCCSSAPADGDRSAYGGSAAGVDGYSGRDHDGVDTGRCHNPERQGHPHPPGAG